MNIASNKNSENMMDMEIETTKNDFLYSDRINSCFLPLLKEESQRNKENNSNTIDNLFSYNISNMTGEVNINNNCVNNKENRNTFNPGWNKEKIMKISILLVILPLIILTMFL